MTIECMSNKKTKSAVGSMKQSATNDISFYKPRLFKLTNQLLNSDIPKDMWDDVIEKYNIYIHSCIIYFKSIDTHNIIQEEHLVSTEPIGLDDIPRDEVDHISRPTIEYIRPVTYDMNHFVIKTNKSKGINPPRFRDVILETTDLKYKDCGPDSDILINEDDIAQHSLDVVLPYKYFVSLDDDTL